MAGLQKMSSYIPLEAAVPSVPSNEILTDLQWETLLALADTVIPSVRVGADASPNQKTVTDEQFESAVSKLAANIQVPNATDVARAYLQENASSLQGFRDGLQCLFANDVHEEGRKGLCMILDVLNTRAGALLLTGSMIPVQNQPLKVREQIFTAWGSSRLPPIRLIHRSLLAMFKKTWMVSSPALPIAVGIPRVPVHGKPADGFEYEFLQFPPSNDPEIIETDVVIIGSGCGGAVTAKNLAEAGHRVLVVEKSYHYPSKYFPMETSKGLVNLYEGAGSALTDDASVALFAGSTWGGGGTINWACSLQTQAFVRKEWADSGLPFFTSAEFQNSLDRVCDRMGVDSKHIKHNRQNQVILEGARKLGYATEIVPQNTGDEDHYCGYCTMGCAAAGKRGPTETWLADAAKAGAIFMEGFKADKITFAEKGESSKKKGLPLVWKGPGLQGTLISLRSRILIKAKKVIVSCGTLNSPLLLLRSGLTNWNIGRNLHLHPVLFGAAIFDEEIRPWEGSALTTLVKEFENLDGHGHGAKVEATVTLPPMYLPTFPWRDGLDYKLFCANLSHMTSFISITRDRDSGRVYPDPVDGRIRVQYTPSAFDRQSCLEALIASAKIAYVSGAKEYHTSYADMPPFYRSEEASGPDGIDEGINNAEFQKWINQLRQKSPLNVEKAFFSSAHQMGTCRMASTAAKGVVDPECQVWGTKGLYVIDASIFPSASGVNPMVTNMAIADWASKNLSKNMRKEEMTDNPSARL
ncbi:long chain fatty alcohol oxidase [Penicillium frequentans]|uniref:Long-chain-alcohol oxidase n=1 Tax=Penicillium frequentans TaxID=3151616 RepID=A0AAD6CNU8_9EURO|nr:long chain fatty alcohol oxidase [Penicillium glabrum]